MKEIKKQVEGLTLDNADEVMQLDAIIKELDEIEIKLTEQDIIEEPIKKAASQSLKSLVPKNYLIPNNKLANEITKDFLDKGKIGLIVSGKNQKKDVITYSSLNYDGNGAEIYGCNDLTPYERVINNATLSLYIAGNDVVTPAMVYRTMTGMAETETPSKQAVHTICECLNKSSCMKLRIDFTEEAKMRGVSIRKAVMEGYLLPAESVTISTGGNEVSAFKILKSPILYEYAQMTKQVISVPLTLLDIREAKAVRNTGEIIAIKEYLIRRIEVMRRNKDMGNKIVYETIFSEAGITEVNTKKSFSLRNNIKAILELWERNKYIKNFSEYKDGKTIKGVSITY